MREQYALWHAPGVETCPQTTSSLHNRGHVRAATYITDQPIILYHVATAIVLLTSNQQQQQQLNTEKDKSSSCITFPCDPGV